MVSEVPADTVLCSHRTYLWVLRRLFIWLYLCELNCVVVELSRKWLSSLLQKICCSVFWIVMKKNVVWLNICRSKNLGLCFPGWYAIAFNPRRGTVWRYFWLPPTQNTSSTAYARDYYYVPCRGYLRYTFKFYRLKLSNMEYLYSVT